MRAALQMGIYSPQSTGLSVPPESRTRPPSNSLWLRAAFGWDLPLHLALKKAIFPTSRLCAHRIGLPWRGGSCLC